MADEQRETEKAEQIGLEKQKLQAIEDAARQAVQLIDEGTSYEAVPDKVIDVLPRDHRRAVRTVFTQKISGQPAPFNASLEVDLHDAWIRAINGDSTKFLSMPLAQHLGSHNRERLGLWRQRQASLKAANPGYMAELNRRKLAMREQH